MFRFFPSLVCLSLSVSWILAGEPLKPGTPGWFPFTISTTDSTATPIDLSWLNEMPAGKSGFLHAKGENIVNAKEETVRLFGTNFCGAACFQDEAVSKKIAAHLAKNGINVVRLHHMDNGWPNSASLIEDNAANKISAGNLAKMDNLVAALIAKGIYINLNLHVSRTYPGTPKGAPNYSKGLDYFHPPFIARFKDFTRQILNHVNPHTGRAYKDEPGIAVIEMNNENALVSNPWWINSLPEPFNGELRSRFAEYLRGIYPDTTALRASWGTNDGTVGPELIRNGNFASNSQWTVEQSGGALATLVPLTDGSKGARWTSSQAGKFDWSLLLSQSGLNFDETANYRLKFRARSRQRAKLIVSCQNSGEPWAGVGLRETVRLTPEWQEFKLDFKPSNSLPGGANRIAFNLLNTVTEVDLTDVSLRSVSDGFLKPGQTLEAGNISLPESNSNLAVRKDYFGFLMDLEIQHARRMKAFIKDEIGAKQIITHSQASFGGIAGSRREGLVSDLVDTHGYWHHPSFPNKPWDQGDWLIHNVSQIADEAGGVLAEMAMHRVAGKPFSVSEYDTPAPNDYVAETFPLVAAMGCLQNWSAIYQFNFKNDATLESDRITGFFDLPGHPGKQAFMPLAALVFRKGLIEPLTATTSLSLSDESIRNHSAQKSGDVWGSWRDLWASPERVDGIPPVTGAEAWKRRVELHFSGKSDETQLARSTTEPAHLLWNPKQLWLGIDGKGAQLWSGKLTTTTENIVGSAVSVSGIEADENATLMLVALDGQNLDRSKKLWLCAMNRAENPGMGWNSARTSIGKNWGTGPALVRGVNAKIHLPGNAAEWKVEALDATGTVKSTVAEKTATVEITPAQQTVWWLITRP